MALLLLVASLLSHWFGRHIGRQVLLRDRVSESAWLLHDATSTTALQEQQVQHFRNRTVPRSSREWQTVLLESMSTTTIAEAFVHPALLTHPYPKTVALVSNNDTFGCSLVQQIQLHHSTIESIVLLLLSGEDTHLECSPHRPSSIRFQIVELPFLLTDSNSTHDALQRLQLDYGDQMDVVLVDHRLTLVDNEPYFWQEVVGPLIHAEHGILSVLLSEPPSAMHRHAVDLFEYFADDLGMVSTSHYSIGMSRVSSSGLFHEVLISLRNWDDRVGWYRNEAEVNLLLQQRLEGTLDYFDGATHATYQHSSRTMENMHCRSLDNEDDEDEQPSCQHGYDPEVQVLSGRYLETRPSTVANGGRGIFTTQNISAGTIVGLDVCIGGVLAYPLTYNILDVAQEEWGEHSRFWHAIFIGYLEGYGWGSTFYVSAHVK